VYWAQAFRRGGKFDDECLISRGKEIEEIITPAVTRNVR
jgi:hypothetical protein